MTKCLLTMHGFKKIVIVEYPLHTIAIPIAHALTFSDSRESGFPSFSKWLFKLRKLSPDLRFAYYDFWEEV